MKLPTVSIALLLICYSLCLLHVSSQKDSCNSNLNFNGLLKFNTSSLICKPVWSTQDYILRYEQTGPNLWSFVLSAPNKNAYVAIGLSPNGHMVRSSAVAGWIASDGTGAIKQYYLGGPTGVFPGTSNRLTEHDSKISTSFNYATGESETEKNMPYSKLRNGHGVINMLGWGILIPIGAIIARFCKKWDPLWFYAHVSIQSIGFIFGVAGMASGLVLQDKTRADVDNHKGLGVFILLLGCLQVIAFLARPDKDSKYRKYWNWYHYIVGRLLILLAAVNIFYGIHLGKAGSTWNTGYALVLAVLSILFVILEFKFLRN